jgi:hypothetical protein
MDERFERARLKWPRSADSHTGPRHMTSRSKGRTHVSTRRRAASRLPISLAPEGASTHVHDHNVARTEFRGEDLRHVGLEGLPVHGPVEHEGGGNPGKAQARHEGRGLPMSVRHARPQALSAGCPAVAPGHVRRRPGFVDEDEARGIQIELALEPGLAPGQDIRAILLGRMGCLFLRVMLWRRK